MQPLNNLTDKAAKKVRGVFTDIDGTLTLNGKLGPDSFTCLWRLKNAGLRVVPVTGRPAGWCDMIARLWPVDGVIGENGALAYWEKDGVLMRQSHPEATPEAQKRLGEVAEAILAEVPGSRISKDQVFRLYNLAIDYHEEPPYLDSKAVLAIRRIFERLLAQAKVSDIHVNGWFGSYDKLDMVKLFVKQAWGEDLDQTQPDYIYCGDSPNDESMFAYFENACGVANIKDFTAQMKFLPRFVAEKPGSAGFSEIVETLLERR